MKNTIKHLILIVFCVFPFLLNAQPYHAEASIDSNQILIGDHLKLHLSYSGDIKTQILFPFLSDTCFNGIEIIERFTPYLDTTNNILNYKQQFILTSFDSGTYVIPPIHFFDSDSVLIASTQPIQLRVNTLNVDTTLAIKDINPPFKVPITLKEILPFILMGVLIIVIIVLLILLILRIKRKQPILPKIKEKVHLPAHVIALKDLETLRLKKLWQQGEYKLYYSKLTNILRVYLENRWDIQAMEMVSYEIIDSLHQQEIEQHLIDKIKYTLHHSDMVKFAKGEPISDENQLSFDNIVYFVNETKETEEKTDQTQKN